MLHILCHEYSNRLSYITEHLAQNVWQLPVRHHFNENEWKEAEGFKLAYLPKRKLDALDSDIQAVRIPQHAFILSKEIEVPEFDESVWKNIPVPFADSAYTQSIPFDFFSTAFFLLSHIEEYPEIEKQQDQFGRILASELWICQKQLEQSPILDILSERIYLLLQQQQQYVKMSVGFEQKRISRETNICYDIDIAYQFKGKGFKSKINAVLKGKIGKQDPFDSYDAIIAAHQERKLPIQMCFLARRKGKHDRSISPESAAFKSILRKMADYARIGIHPSLFSHKDSTAIQEEFQLVQSNVKQPITISRQHYLKHCFPNSATQLIILGIKHDYSIGFTDRFGFKSGTSYPYLWFNLSTNSVEELMLHPIQFMDTVAIRNQTYQLEYLLPLLQQWKKYGGEFNVLFHNSLLQNGIQGEENRTQYFSILDALSTC